MTTLEQRTHNSSRCSVTVVVVIVVVVEELVVEVDVVVVHKNQDNSQVRLVVYPPAAHRHEDS